MGVYDLPRAKALLDTYGYVDRDGDGWREQPDGSPLVYPAHDSTRSKRLRPLDEILKRNLTSSASDSTFKYGKWPEQLKSARARS